MSLSEHLQLGETRDLVICFHAVDNFITDTKGKKTCIFPIKTILPYPNKDRALLHKDKRASLMLNLKDRF